MAKERESVGTEIDFPVCRRRGFFQEDCIFLVFPKQISSESATKIFVWESAEQVAIENGATAEDLHFQQRIPLLVPKLCEENTAESNREYHFYAVVE